MFSRTDASLLTATTKEIAERARLAEVTDMPYVEDIEATVCENELPTGLTDLLSDLRHLFEGLDFGICHREV